MQSPEEKTKELLRDLPDPEGARLFYERLTAEHPRAARRLASDAGLRADALALAAWSPLLATTLAQNPEYLPWLARERTDAHVRTTEELQESLARFALTHSQESPQALLARFRRRELLRVYLRDIRRTATVVEITEELSNLADAVLAYALDLARQELDNRYGAPLRTDERGRRSVASFCVIALGKLGSRELNYSSDIDLLFLYSDDGETSGAGDRGATTNREYFNRLAEKIARLVGAQTGAGAAYRVDLRLRPHGRDGALSVSAEEAVRYYRRSAQAWELQALIRARAAAGSQSLFVRFDERVRERVYTHAGSAAEALCNVRLAKQKIDRQHGAEGRGFNVKLGRGGIREIEFIAQALQLAHGARDPWLHAPHTLISLGRLADRSLLTERERAELSDAYAYLRTLEHRLQMEHGLQTHTVPEDAARRAMVARRMHFSGKDALAQFDRALSHHTACVSATFARVFGRGDEAEADRTPAMRDTRRLATQEEGWRVLGAAEPPATRSDRPAAAQQASEAVTGAPASGLSLESAELPSSVTEEFARRTLNPRRARAYLARIFASVEKSEARIELTNPSVEALARVCGASEFFGEMIASNPELISALPAPRGQDTDGPGRAGEAREHRASEGLDYRATLRAAIDGEKNFRAELAALRRAWSRLLVETGARDVAGELELAESNRRQTELAIAALNVALLVARRELARRTGGFRAGPRLSVLALGRLASSGVDYGSDLDVVLVYDERVPPPLPALTREQAYARLCELMTTALSSLTREGYLYRVDLRLRPDGKNGPLASGSRSFLAYLGSRTQVWEWLAYVKLRAVAGDLEFGRAVESEARRAVHEAARALEREELRRETRRMRERLEQERAARRARALDIKFGAGGMLDVYFAARYLQLRDDVRDRGEDRSTRASLARLRAAGSLDAETHRALDEGYALLRALDHGLRLVAGRSSQLSSAPDHPLLEDLARWLGFDSPRALAEILRARMEDVRAAYERVTG